MLIAPVTTSNTGQPMAETRSVTRHQRPNMAPTMIRVGITAGSFPPRPQARFRHDGLRHRGGRRVLTHSSSLPNHDSVSYCRGPAMAGLAGLRPETGGAGGGCWSREGRGSTAGPLPG